MRLFNETFRNENNRISKTTTSTYYLTFWGK